MFIETFSHVKIELKESFEPIFEQKPHEDPKATAAYSGLEISLKASKNG
ncbi:MAG: hypothetical protein CM15mV58_430 [uncultured marine virus]|nr:MAG: hypothetical protein CM15mV58_430 [uncultured marine virus]